MLCLSGIAERKTWPTSSPRAVCIFNLVKAPLLSAFSPTLPVVTGGLLGLPRGSQGIKLGLGLGLGISAVAGVGMQGLWLAEDHFLSPEQKVIFLLLLSSHQTVSIGTCLDSLTHPAARPG